MHVKAGRGRIFARGEAGFEDAVRGSSFSSHESGRWPDYVHQANDIDDVIEAVSTARSRNLKISMCSGGHSWSQNHIRDSGMMLDLSRLNSMEIDVVNKTAIVGPALHGGDFDAALAKHGLFFPVAHAYTVGLGGFLLQGGFGWNCRVVGMACESVTAIDVVLADGRLVHASETENSDLLWAARGAGAGFFGVVVRFYLKLHDRPKYIGIKTQVFRLRHLEDVLTWADSIKHEVSPKIEFQIVFNRKAIGIFSHGLEIAACVLADSRKEAKELLRFLDKGPMRKKASLTLPLFGLTLNRIMKIGEKVLFWPNCRWFTDNAWMKSPIGPALPAIRKIAETQPEAPSHAYWQIWNPATKERPDMAFSLEGDSYFALYGALPIGRGTPDDETWATRGAIALQEFSTGIQLGDENLARRPAPFMAPENFEKLTAIRGKYDPEGRFNSYGHLN